MVKTGQVWSGLVVTKDATGALATPSVGPAGVLYVDGTANAASVTISGANPYKWTVTLPTLTAGQCVSMYITATIATIATAGVVAEDVADTVRLSDVPAVNVTYSAGVAVSGRLAEVTDLPSEPLDATATQAAAAAALTAYDPPSKAELDAGFLALVGADGDTLETLSDQLDVVDANVDAVLADTAEMQGDLADGGRIDALIDGIKSKTDLITTGLVTVTSPVTSDGDVTVYQGDDYHDGDGCALAWSSSSWPDLTGASVALYVKAPSGELLTAVGSAVDPGTATQTARVELTAAETATLVAWPAPSELRVRATLSNGRVRTLVDSTLAAIEELQ